MEKEELTEGQEVRVFDRNGGRAGQPEGGWPGAVVKIKREYATIRYEYGSGCSEDFLIRTQKNKDAFRWFRTMAQHDIETRRYRAKADLMAHGLRMEGYNSVPLEKLERIIAILKEGEK